jgi:hypothetical protein
MAHKTEAGTSNMWELLIANHLDQSFMFTQSNTGSTSQIIFIMLLSSRCTLHSFAAPFTSLSKLTTYAGVKLFFKAKPAYFDSSSCYFNVLGHIMSTGGDALLTQDLPPSNHLWHPWRWCKIRPSPSLHWGRSLSLIAKEILLEDDHTCFFDKMED